MLTILTHATTANLWAHGIRGLHSGLIDVLLSLRSNMANDEIPRDGHVNGKLIYSRIINRGVSHSKNPIYSRIFPLIEELPIQNIPFITIYSGIFRVPLGDVPWWKPWPCRNQFFPRPRGERIGGLRRPQVLPVRSLLRQVQLVGRAPWWHMRGWPWGPMGDRKDRNVSTWNI